MGHFVFGATLILFLTSCQVYKSVGRKQFETNAPSNLVSGEIGSRQIVEKNGLSCWSQPANESLWFYEDGQSYEVHSLENSQIEVCFEESH